MASNFVPSPILPSGGTEQVTPPLSTSGAFPVSGTSITVASVGGDAADQLELSRLVAGQGMRLCGFDDADSCVRYLNDHPIQVIVAHADHDGQAWKGLLEAPQPAATMPRPRLIVASRNADHLLWSEVLNFGGYNVLAKPFDRREVEWVLEQACLDWLAECEQTTGAGLAKLLRAVRR